MKAPKMTVEELKGRLYSRHPGHAGQMPGAWTVVEEWRGIDVLAFSAWSSASSYARVGYEVKVTRGDLRRELLRPSKREANVEWCNQFYLAVPEGLLNEDELAFVEPPWEAEDWLRERCPAGCIKWGRGRNSYAIERPVPAVLTRVWRREEGWERVTCPACDGKGNTGPSRVEREAPTLWVPKNVGLVVADGRYSKILKKSPRRHEVPPLNPAELGQLVRWVSMRPDRRHHSERAAA